MHQISMELITQKQIKKIPKNKKRAHANVGLTWGSECLLAYVIWIGMSASKTTLHSVVAPGAKKTPHNPNRQS